MTARANGPGTPRTVFISHTSELRDYPSPTTFYEAAENAVKRLRWAPVAQPYFAPDEAPAAELVRQLIAECDLFVAIIGHKWGTAVRGHEEMSYVEFEYRVAGELGKERRVFLLEEDLNVSGMPRSALFDPDHYAEQAAFRSSLVNDDAITVAFVANPANLDSVLYQALAEYQRSLDAETPVAGPSRRAGRLDDLPPYGDIAQRLAQGSIIPFLGPGSSLPSDYEAPAPTPRPSLHDLERRLAERPPSLAELSLILAHRANYPEQPSINLLEIAEYVDTVTSDRTLLRTYVDELLRSEFEPRPIHALLADITKPLLMFTTCFDDLLERAFRNHDPPVAFQLAVQPYDPARAPSIYVSDDGSIEGIELRPVKAAQLKVGEVPIIFKLRGSFTPADPPGAQYVITEDDHVDLLVRLMEKTALPDELYETMTGQTRFLFLGFDLRDWGRRTLLTRLKESTQTDPPPGVRLNRQPGYSFSSAPTATERELWRVRNVRAYDSDLDELARRLRQELPQTALVPAPDASGEE